jgi:GxxExxY protein
MPCALKDVMRTEADLNRTASEIIGAAIAVHRVIGPGCFESAYVACLAYEFRTRRLEYCTKVPIAIQYEELTVPRAYEADFIVRGDIVVEVKATSSLTPLDARQLQTYLRFSGCPLGLLLNFGSLTLADGIKRIVNNFPSGGTLHVPSQRNQQSGTNSLSVDAD